jgi:hypothetical protein
MADFLSGFNTGFNAGNKIRSGWEEREYRERQLRALQEHQRVQEELQRRQVVVQERQQDVTLLDRIRQVMTDTTLHPQAKSFLLDDIARQRGQDPNGDYYKGLKKVILTMPADQSRALTSALIGAYPEMPAGSIGKIVDGLLTGGIQVAQIPQLVGELNKMGEAARVRQQAAQVYGAQPQAAPDFSNPEPAFTSQGASSTSQTQSADFGAIADLAPQGTSIDASGINPQIAGPVGAAQQRVNDAAGVSDADIAQRQPTMGEVFSAGRNLPATAPLPGRSPTLGEIMPAAPGLPQEAAPVSEEAATPQQARPASEADNEVITYLRLAAQARQAGDRLNERLYRDKAIKAINEHKGEMTRDELLTIATLSKQAGAPESFSNSVLQMAQPSAQSADPKNTPEYWLSVAGRFETMGPQYAEYAKNAREQAKALDESAKKAEQTSKLQTEAEAASQKKINTEQDAADAARFMLDTLTGAMGDAQNLRQMIDYNPGKVGAGSLAILAQDYLELRRSGNPVDAAITLAARAITDQATWNIAAQADALKAKLGTLNYGEVRKLFTAGQLTEGEWKIFQNLTTSLSLTQDSKTLVRNIQSAEKIMEKLRRGSLASYKKRYGKALDWEETTPDVSLPSVMSVAPAGPPRTADAVPPPLTQGQDMDDWNKRQAESVNQFMRGLGLR